MGLEFQVMVGRAALLLGFPTAAGGSDSAGEMECLWDLFVFIYVVSDCGHRREEHQEGES